MVQDIQFSPNGKKIVTVSEDGTIKLWDLEGKLISTFIGHTKPVNCIEFSPDGTRIVTASDDKTARIWDLKGNQLAVFEHENEVPEVQYSKDGTRIITTTSYGKVKSWLTIKGIIQSGYFDDCYQLTADDYYRMGIDFMGDKVGEK